MIRHSEILRINYYIDLSNLVLIWLTTQLLLKTVIISTADQSQLGLDGLHNVSSIGVQLELLSRFCMMTEGKRRFATVISFTILHLTVNDPVLPLSTGDRFPIM